MLSSAEEDKKSPVSLPIWPGNELRPNCKSGNVSLNMWAKDVGLMSQGKNSLHYLRLVANEVLKKMEKTLPSVDRGTYEKHLGKYIFSNLTSQWIVTLKAEIS